MRKDAGVDGDAQRIGQMAWLLFLKIFDSQEEELELIQDDYEPPIPPELLWRNWATSEKGLALDGTPSLTGEGMLKFIEIIIFEEVSAFIRRRPVAQ